MKMQLLTLSLIGVTGLSLVSATPAVQASTTGRLTATTVTYNAKTKAATFTGKASAKVKKVVLQYAHTKKVTATVKNHRFKVTKGFSGYRAFKLYGTNAKGKRLTKVATIGADRYATKQPRLVQLDRSGVVDTLLVTMQVPKASVVTIYQQQHVLAQQYSSQTPALFHLTGIKAKKYQLTATTKQTDKKTSPALKFPVVKPGYIMNTILN